ncbi:hypothetical protein [Sulfurospirillum sp. UCH001]|uniref:hypothetical protein n=1 Tax=Sulfurospirillum sp. UCH001 TaxID=1581011 RepID=UPI0008301DAF|nr:hypothetical protein [Sulfurospirillum sp. UCH001]
MARKQDINTEEQRVKNMIERCRSRYIAKRDKMYLKYKTAFFSEGKFMYFHYPFRGLTKEEITSYLSNKNLPYTDIFSI